MPFGSNIANTEDGARAQLALHGPVEMLSVRQTVFVEEGHFGVSAERFERRKIKSGVRIFYRRAGRYHKRKFLPVAARDAVEKRSFKEFLPPRRPKETEGKVANLLNLTEVFEGGIENSKSSANTGFS